MRRILCLKTRKESGLPSFAPFWSVVVPLVAMLVLLLAASRTPLWSQNNDSKLNDSEPTLSVWENLSSRFQSELTGLQNDLQAALVEATQSRMSSERSMALYEISLQRIRALEVFNEQIGSRMQQRDMELYWAYQDIDDLEQTVLKKDKTILKLIIVIIVLGVILLGAIALAVLRFYFKKKIPFLR
jgi:hypothetical protein